MPKIDVSTIPDIGGTSYPARYAAVVEGRTRRALGDAGGLTQFGVNLVTLQPGAASSLRHWHERQDEFLWMLEGELVLVEDDGEHPMRPGDVASWKAGVANGHHLVNRSNAPARFIVVGSRSATETCRYSDVDLMMRGIEGHNIFTTRNGESVA
jgi:uncharacterized cupin superfamily protein